MPESTPASEPRSRLDQISTRWSAVGDPVQFLMRYGAAVHRYLAALLKNDDDARDVSQDLLARVVAEGFPSADPGRGRFRDYLKAVLRNAAISRLRRKRPVGGDLERLAGAAADDGPDESDREWVAGWRKCLLDRAWADLEVHQSRSPGNLCHTVLRLAANHPDEDSAALASRAERAAGRPIKVDAFRKQLSRARRLFAGLLLTGVAATLDDPAPDRVEAELIELGLMDLIRGYLPPDWRAGTLLPEAAE